MLETLLENFLLLLSNERLDIDLIRDFAVETTVALKMPGLLADAERACAEGAATSGVERRTRNLLSRARGHAPYADGPEGPPDTGEVVLPD